MSDQHDDLDTSDDRFTTANTALVGLGVLVAMVIVAVLGYLAFDAERDDVVADGVGTTAPTTMVPSEPAPAEPAEPLGADSALVGLTEAQVRELYPLVRVVQVDGQVLPATMDLQPGRISLAIEGDTVVGATVEGCEEAGAQDATWLQQSCDPDPDNDGPNASGKLLADGESGFTLEVGTEGDQYYQGMSVAVDPDLTRVLDSNGTPLVAEDLTADDVVWIWTGDCAESSPVQCEIQAIVVDRPAS